MKLHSQLANSALECLDDADYEPGPRISAAQPSALLGLDRPRPAGKTQFELVLPQLGGLL